MPAWRKMELTAEMGRTVQMLALAGLCQRYPGLLLGPDLAVRAYGPPPEEDGC